MSSDPHTTVRGELVPPPRPGAVFQVKVTCPYCRQPHDHGAGPDGTRLGWRSPECGRGEQFYIVVDRTGS